MICKSSLAIGSESSAPSSSTRGGFGFFRWLESGVGKAGLWPSFSGQSNAHGTERLEQSLQEEESRSYVSHEGVPARDRDCSLFLPFLTLWDPGVFGRK